MYAFDCWRNTDNTEVAKEIYGKHVKVYLFGSRTDDTKWGGDIDLLVRTPQQNFGILARIRMIARLKELLGDQKIDVIGDHEYSVVAKEAMEQGILLSWVVSTNLFSVSLSYKMR